MKRIALQPGYVLHRRPFRNNSHLLEIFTPEYGRVGMVARTSSSRNRQASQFSPFQRLLCSWNQRSELGTLTACETGSDYTVLAGDSLFAALYVNEILMKLLPRDVPDPELFALYESVIGDIADKASPLEKTLRLFEKNLLEILGYALPLTIDCHGEPISPESRYIFSNEEGLIPVHMNAHQVNGVLGKSMLDLEQETLDNQQSLHEAKRVLRQALKEQLGDRVLKIRDCYNRQY